MNRITIIVISFLFVITGIVWLAFAVSSWLDTGIVPWNDVGLGIFFLAFPLALRSFRTDG